MCDKRTPKDVCGEATHRDDEITCEWSWFMSEASYLPLVGMPHWHPLGLMGSELYVKVLLCQLYLISLK